MPALASWAHRLIGAPSSVLGLQAQRDTELATGREWCAVSLSALYLHSLDLQLHVVLSGRLPVFPLFPAISILPVLHFLPVVEDH